MLIFKLLKMLKIYFIVLSSPVISITLPFLISQGFRGIDIPPNTSGQIMTASFLATISLIISIKLSSHARKKWHNGIQ